MSDMCARCARWTTRAWCAKCALGGGGRASGLRTWQRCVCEGAGKRMFVLPFALRTQMYRARCRG